MQLEQGTINVLSSAEVSALHGAAQRILQEVGLCVEHEAILERLAAHGAIVDWARQRALFPAPLVERFLADSERSAPATGVEVTASAGIYYSLYHDPESGKLLPWTQERLASYAMLAKRLEHIGAASMLGCPLADPPQLAPLYERLYCWRYGIQEAGSIHLDELCPFILELYEMRASWLGRPLKEIFRGSAYLVPPLKLGRHEAYQFHYFAERGLPISLGDQYATGATAPVTMAGALALSLAEQLAVGILQRAFHGGRRFALHCSISPLDMRTMFYPYGRPEMALANLAMAQMARHYGLPFYGHAGLTDAKLPSAEAGYQKALTALPTLLASGRLHMDAGLLAVDEICSPLQLIIDNEFLGALKHLCQSFPTDEEALALELIASIGPGGNFIATEHTARHFRQEHWEPQIWSREPLQIWLGSSQPLDVDRAREIYQGLLPGLVAAPELSPEQEREIQGLIRRAQASLAL